jgi:hypothetical protein
MLFVLFWTFGLTSLLVLSPVSNSPRGDHESLVVPVQPSFPFEPNDNINQSALIEPGYYMHYLTVNEDWYYFDADAAEFLDVSIYFVHSSGDLNLELYNSNAINIGGSYSANDEERVTFTSPRLGRYYIRVFNAVNEYAIQLSVTGWVSIDKPGANVKWYVDDVQEIAWSSSLNVRHVNIVLRKNNTFHSTIASNASSNGSFLWNIPNSLITGNDYQVMVSDSSVTSVRAFSPFFWINASKAIIFLNPESGSTFFTNKLHTIRWYTSGIIPSVNITLFENLTFVMDICLDLANTGSCQWRVPDDLIPAYDYRLEIVDADNASWRFSSPAFAIDDTKSISIVMPSMGTQWHVGLTYQVTWDWTGSVHQVNIQLQRGGQTVTQIASGLENTGSFSWLVSFSLTSGGDYRVQVADAASPEVVATSDLVTINATKAITVSKPGSQTMWYTGTSVTISWVSTGAIYLVDVLLLRAGSLLFSIAMEAPNTGFYTWYIPTSLTGNYSTYQVKIQDHHYPSVSSTSGQFTVNDTKTIYVNTPLHARAGSVLEISWFSTGAIGTLDISLRRDSAFISWILTDTANDGSHRWLIPSTITLGVGYSIRVSHSENPESVYKDSGAFEILAGIPAQHSYPVAAGDRITWTTGFNVAMDLPDFAWEEIESQLSMAGADLDAEQAFNFLMQSKPNSWHVQARMKGFAGNERIDGVDHAFADLFVKENTKRDYLPLGTYMGSELGGSYDAIGSLFSLPRDIGDDAGTNLDLNEWGNIMHALMPLSPNSTVPGLILPVGLSFKDAHEALVAGIASNEAFIALFGSWEEFTQLIQWSSSLENDSIHVEFDLLPLILHLPTGVALAAFPFLSHLVQLAEDNRLDFDVRGVTCYLTVDYDETGILDTFDLDVHVQGVVNVLNEHGPFIIYIELITLQGELPSITFKHVRFITAEHLIAFPLIVGSACVLIALFWLVKKRHYGKRIKCQVI